MSKRWLGAVAGLAAAAAMAGTAFANAPPATKYPVRIERITPVKTMPVRDMRNIQLPSIMQRIIGDQHFTKDEIGQLRQKLIKSGYLAPPGAHHALPVRYAQRVVTSPQPVHLQNVQTKVISAPSSITTGVAFPGIGESDNPPDIPSVAPPDTNAAVGQNDVIEIVNLGYPDVGAFKIWDKQGNVVQGTTSLSTFWSSGDCTSGYGDNVVKYDQFAQRWIMLQFTPSLQGVCLAISAQTDPTGSWYTYEFTLDTSAYVTDYPKLGVWPVNDTNQDAYLLTDNDFQYSGDVWTQFVALQRSAMLAGNTAEMTIFNGTGLLEGGYDYSVLPSDVDGMTLPPTDDPGIFVDYISPLNFGGSTYALDMWQMTPDWATPGNATLTGPTQIDVNSFTDGAYSCAQQPSPGECLPSLGDRLMFRLAYRNSNSSTSDQILVVNHTVVGQDGSSLTPDWYQLDAPAGSMNAGDWAVDQQSIYDPNDGSSRWMGSIAMDHIGDLGLGFSLTSSANGIDPSIVVTGQNVGAPNGQMDAGEHTLLSGTGVQESTGRWGDYSSMAIDPVDDCTFWYAQEYITTTGSFSWSTGLGSFKFNACSIGPTGTLTGTITDAGSGNPIQGATVTLSPGGHAGSSNSSGVYQVVAAATSTGPTTYTAAATAFGYQESDASVQITDGGTTTQDFSLTAAPTATLSGRVTDSGHGYPLYADVKVSFNGATVADVWTNPIRGTYSVTLPQGSGYSMTVTPYVDGFTAGTATVDLSGNTRQSFALTPDSSCSAPGYGLGKALAEDFDGGTFPPSGWTVATGQNNGYTHWQTNTSYQDGNYTNGSSVAADAENNRGGPGLGAYSTSLVTPPISVSALSGGTTLQYTANYQDYPDYSDALDLGISTDGGNTWTTISSWSDPSQDCGALYATPGCNVSMDISSYLPQSGSFLLRWHYYDYNPNAWDWYAQIDNVSLGTTECNAIPGGMLAMTASDANTHQLMSGVTITDENGNSVTTTPIASYNNKPGAFMFEPSGNHTLTASYTGYADAVVHKSVAPGSTEHVSFALGAGRLAVAPTSLTVNAPVDATTTVTITIGNTGTAPADWKLISINAPPSNPGQGGGGGVVPVHNIHCANPVSSAVNKPPAPCGGGNDKPTLSPDQASSWAAIANYPQPGEDVALARDRVTGLLYAVGGSYGYCGSIVANTYSYDATANSWTSLADAPQALLHPAAAFVNGKLYIIDGMPNSCSPSNATYIYDPGSNTWSQGTDSPNTHAYAPGVAVLNNKIYVIGGCADEYCDGTAKVDVYDPTSGTWSTAADYPHPVAFLGCGAIDGKIYCAGGTYGANFYSDTWEYDPNTNSWTQKADMPNNGDWGGAYTADFRYGLLIALGVTDNSSQITNMGWIYSPSTDTWSDLPNALVSDFRVGGGCGFYQVGGGFNPNFGEVLAGYDECDVGPVPWLSFNPVSGTLNAHSQTTETFTIDGTGQPPRTSSTVQVILSGNTPYGGITIPLQVNWTYGSKPQHK